MLYHQMQPNKQLICIKSFYRAKQKKKFKEKAQDYKDGSGIQFINFYFVTGDQEINVSIPVEFWFF